MRGVSTVSNLFWAQQYNLLDFWRYYPHLELNEYSQIIREAIETGNLLKVGDNKLIRGANLEIVSSNVEHGLQSYFDFDKLIQLIELAVQVVSELSFQNKFYSPSIDDMELLWQIKIWLNHVKTKDNISEFVAKFQSELTVIGTNLPEENSVLLFNQFVGHKHVGLTTEQLSRALNIAAFEIDFRIRETFLEVINIVENKKLPLFSALITPVQSSSKLTHSALISWNLFKNGTEIPKIASLRRIKENTVREHLMMAAILEADFPFEKFIDLDLFLDEFDLNSKKPDEWTYQMVLQKDASVSFFSFRLAQIKQGQLNYLDKKRT
ncbi:hypothetical protein IV79_GL001363 [Pediococcus claussenii]|nr:hypothetical protein IV79_GL001363 [Pediococcus claussenii]